jgi:hypothetical protein
VWSGGLFNFPTSLFEHGRQESVSICVTLAPALAAPVQVQVSAAGFFDLGLIMFVYGHHFLSYNI